MSKEKDTTSKGGKVVANPYGRNGKKAAYLHKALALYQEDWKLSRISEELDIHPTTLRRWLREEGLPPKKTSHSANPDKNGNPISRGPNHTSIFEPKPEDKTWGGERNDRRVVKLNEEEGIENVASAQRTPAEQYQSYMAAQSAKLMRDGMKNMPAPKNVREMEVLDKIARKHFGLDGDQTSGLGSLAIDISILNGREVVEAETPKVRKAKKPKVVDVNVEKPPKE